MKEYLEYLEKLNSLVDTNELERVQDDCQRQTLQIRKWGYLSLIVLLSTLVLSIRAFDVLGDSLGNLLRSVLYGVPYDSNETVIWLILFIVAIGFTLWSMITYIHNKEKLSLMLGISYVEHSYATVRNTIIDEGEEFMRKLFIWERLYTLTIEDKRKYDYVLKVIRTLRVEYERFENKGV